MKILYPSRTKGFTMVELLVVIAIIAALASVSSVAFFRVFESGKAKGTQLLITEIDAALLTNFREYPEEGLPAHVSQGLNSTKRLYSFLTGDGFDGVNYTTANGKIDGTDKEGPYPALLPPLDSQGNPLFESSRCRVTPQFNIRDMFGQTLRYYIGPNTNVGRANNFAGGFDLWSAGRDQATLNSPNSQVNGVLADDIKNW